jgi:hypothetical protein
MHPTGIFCKMNFPCCLRIVMFKHANKLGFSGWISSTLLSWCPDLLSDNFSRVWFDQDHLCYRVVCCEEELTDLWYLVCDSPGESVTFVLAPHWSRPTCYWICIHSVIIWNYCVYCQFVSLCVWPFIIWPAALILWRLFSGRCLSSYMIFLWKCFFGSAVIVGCQSTVGVPKCLE